MAQPLKVKKVTYSQGPLRIKDLVEYCPFCEGDEPEQIFGKKCPRCFPDQRDLPDTARADAKWCPLCGQRVTGGHDCNA